MQMWKWSLGRKCLYALNVVVFGIFETPSKFSPAIIFSINDSSSTYPNSCSISLKIYRSINCDLNIPPAHAMQQYPWLILKQNAPVLATEQE